MKARGLRTVLGVLGIGVLLSSSAVAWAGPAGDQLKASVDKVIAVLEDPAAKADGKARRASIRKEATDIFDVREAAARALGVHWQGLGDRDREEFVALFADLLERAYVSKIEKYSGEKITYVGEAAEGDRVTVKTRFVLRPGSEATIDYRMFERDGRWRAYDVVIEGVSLIANYRAQFEKIIQASSYADLVAKLKSARG